MQKGKIKYLEYTNFKGCFIIKLHIGQEVLWEGCEKYRVIEIDDVKKEIVFIKLDKNKLRNKAEIIRYPYHNECILHYYGEEREQIARILKTLFIVSLLTFNPAIFLFMLLLWLAYMVWAENSSD